MEDIQLQTSTVAKENGQTSESTIPQWLVYLEIIVKWRKFIAVTTFGATAIATLVSFLLPVWYLSYSTILTEKQNDLLGLSKLIGIGGFASDFLGKGNLSEDVDRYEAIFKSERLRLAVIEKFNLIQVYELDDDKREPLKNTLKELAENIGFKDNKDGTITITAYYKEDSTKAAEMTNFIVAMMDSINRQLGTESARNQRIFIERRYVQALEELKTAEENLNQFQKQYKVAEVKDQVRASLEASAQLEASAVQSEVEYNVLRKTLGEAHPQVFTAKSKADELRRQAKKFEVGGLEFDVIIPFSKMPDVAMAYLRLYRQVLLQTKILEFLVPQYEQAKIQEAKDTPTLLILDKARVPEWKAKPKRLFIILGGAIAAIILSLAVAFSVELWAGFGTNNPAESTHLKNTLSKLTNLKSYYT